MSGLSGLSGRREAVRTTLSGDTLALHRARCRTDQHFQEPHRRGENLSGLSTTPATAVVENTAYPQIAVLGAAVVLLLFFFFFF